MYMDERCDVVRLMERYVRLRRASRDLSGALDGVWVDGSVSAAKASLDLLLSEEGYGDGMEREGSGRVDGALFDGGGVG